MVDGSDQIACNKHYLEFVLGQLPVVICGLKAVSTGFIKIYP